MKIAIVGGGISGLSVAAFLEPSPALTVFEASSSAGGLIRSQTKAGVVRDMGANGFLNDEPAMNALLDLLGLREQCVSAQDGDRFLLHKGKAVALPQKPPGILTTPLIPILGRLRLLLEPFQSLKKQEQCVADYLQHRIGKGAMSALADAMVSGIWAGDIQALSMQAAFPRLVQSVEKEGSIYKAMKAKKASASPTAKLTSLPGGLGQLTETIAHSLKGQLRTECPVSKLERHNEQWRLQTPQGEFIADQVVVALPAHACARLLADVAPKASQTLLEIPTAPVAVVHHLWDAHGWEAPTGFGVLCPRKEGLNTLGVLYSSSIFPQRCPADQVLVRSILGGATAPLFCDKDPQTIQTIALRELEAIWGACPPPLEQSIVVHKPGIPQYTLGHFDRIERIQSALTACPNLYLAGNFLGGVAVKDCVRVANNVALQVRNRLPTRVLN
jgi:oxygen-dependent protoporphyrinogen oxidase